MPRHCQDCGRFVAVWFAVESPGYDSMRLYSCVCGAEGDLEA